MRPLLLLDVDGPLNPFGAMPDDRPEGYLAHRLMPPSWEAAERARLRAWGRPERSPTPLPVWLNPAHGPRLSALPYELVWATTWEAEANDFIAPLIGLPELPFVPWPGRRPESRPEPGGKPHWKTPGLVAWAAGRPFAWVDDEITPADRAWVAAHHGAPALLLRIDPNHGLRAEDFTALEAWASALGRPASAAGSAGPSEG
ncbi:hypothetical protein [Streptacidiphilus rugosus]|uniref:hypothetical protein n=1 Tax=Streptacidiphilus rugosus TaxID=405783 RepID=UPI000559CCAE|nr:hypothetical protein [Streptacidiphilus rugosus]